MLTNIKKKQAIPYTLIAPVLIFMVLVYGYPLFLTFQYSFQEVSLIGNQHRFIGLDHYKQIFTDVEYYNTLFLTFKWTLLTVCFKLSIGFIIAMLLNGQLYFKRFYRFFLLIPWAIPQVVVAILWSWILSGQYGYLNYYLQKFGLIEKGIAWLSNPSLAFLSTSLVDAWIGIPLITMIFLSGLSSIPESLYEAAKVDGANAWHRFLSITLPSMKTIFIIALILTTIWTFNTFNIIYVLTGGGPMGGTETIMIKIYKVIFGRYDLGMSATLSVTIFLILTILSLIYWRQLHKGEQ